MYTNLEIQDCKTGFTYMCVCISVCQPTMFHLFLFAGGILDVSFLSFKSRVSVFSLEDSSRRKRFPAEEHPPLTVFSIAPS